MASVTYTAPLNTQKYWGNQGSVSLSGPSSTIPSGSIVSRVSISVYCGVGKYNYDHDVSFVLYDSSYRTIEISDTVDTGGSNRITIEFGGSPSQQLDWNNLTTIDVDGENYLTLRGTATITLEYTTPWLNAPSNFSITQTDYNAFQINFTNATGSGSFTQKMVMQPTTDDIFVINESVSNGQVFYINNYSISYGVQYSAYIRADDGTNYEYSNDAYVTFTDRTSCGPPSGLTLAKAILNAGKTCNLTWTAGTAGTWNAISKYEVQYAESSDNSTWGSWTAVSTPTSTTATAIASSTRGNYRKYRIRTIGRWTDSYTSGWVESGSLRCRPKATIPTWEDSTLTAGSTPIKAVHMTQLQTGANNLRATWGLGNGTYSTITAKSTSLKDWKTHVQEIRNALNGVDPDYTPSWTTLPTDNKPSAAIIKQIRDVLTAMA